MGGGVLLAVAVSAPVFAALWLAEVYRRVTARRALGRDIGRGAVTVDEWRARLAARGAKGRA